MNNFFRNIINTLRGIRYSISTHFNPSIRNFPIGSIISGTYQNWKNDYSPTILYFGTYQKPNGKSYVHGINLHYLQQGDLNWLLKLIYMMKRGGQIVNPRQFYYYIKMNKPYMIKSAYRIYHAELCNYYTISPGFSNANVDSCYTVKDGRDVQIQQLNQMINAAYNIQTEDYTNPAKVNYDKEELQRHINEVINTRRII